MVARWDKATVHTPSPDRSDHRHVPATRPGRPVQLVERRLSGMALPTQHGIAFRARHDRNERSATAERTEATLANEPTENADRKDPADPIESIDPTEAIDRTDP